MILVINCGSSSLKYELFRMETEESLASGIADRVGINGGSQGLMKYRNNGETRERSVSLPDHTTAITEVVRDLTDPEFGCLADVHDIKAFGHRVVNGGEEVTASVRIDDHVIEVIDRMSVLSPLHNPPNLMGIEACRELLPDAPNVAVFDTAFHQTMPREAYLYGVPYDLYEQYGLRRYGFHGTSHRYISQVAAEMLEELGIERARQRFITAHLGNGCSMAAVRGGKSVDTSMGMTPLEGLMMGTRSGDIDAAVVTYLQDRMGISAQEATELLNKKSGLLGVSGISSDMRDLQTAAAEGNDRARIAIDLFCYRVRKYIGAYAAVLGGIDAVIFTAGIAENDPDVVERCCADLEFLGIHLDLEKNYDPKAKPPGKDMSIEGSPVRIFIIPTNEELMIARETIAVINNGD